MTTPLFRTILFAADFSAQSKEAFRLACSLANVPQARLLVLHVAKPRPLGHQPVASGEAAGSVASGDGGQPHHDILTEQLREFYKPQRLINIAYHVRDGVTAEELLRKADEVGCDLIVLGTHGRTGLRRLLAGSVAEAVLRGARCPVLALRSAGRTGSAEEIRVILHPTDFSECSESALQVARFLAREHDAQLILLHVAPIDVPIHGATAVAMDPQVYRVALEQLRVHLNGPDLKYPVKARLRQGDAATEILRASGEAGAHLIVMGTYGRSGLGRLLVGSVAESALRGARCPVLMVKAPVPAAVVVASPPKPAPV
jgi:nucleotide-binding universal stress UspA family protein